MMRNFLKAGLLAGAAVGLAASADAAIVVHTTQASFNAASTGVQTDTFNDLAETLYTSPLARSAGTINYRVSAANGLFPGSVAGNRFMSVNTATDPMTFSNFSTPISAIGGRFFSSNISGAFIASQQITVSVTDNLGTTVEVILNPTTASFRGFTTTGTFTSMTVTAFNPVPGTNPIWPSTDDLQLGTAVGGVAPIPEPATWAMMIGGLGLAGTALRRRRVTVAYA